MDQKNRGSSLPVGGTVANSTVPSAKKLINQKNSSNAITSSRKGVANSQDAYSEKNDEAVNSEEIAMGDDAKSFTDNVSRGKAPQKVEFKKQEPIVNIT